MTRVSKDQYAQLDAGLFKIRREKPSRKEKKEGEDKAKKSSSVQVSRDENFPHSYDISITPRTTAAELSAQLARLDVIDLDKEQIEEIAGRNQRFSKKELVELDEYLETVARDDEWFMIRAIARDPRMLQFANDSMGGYSDLVSIALNCSNYDASILQYASSAFRANEHKIASLIRMCRDKNMQGEIWEYMDPSLWNNQHVVETVLFVDPSMLPEVPESFRNDQEFLLERILLSPELIKYVDKKFGNDPDFILRAIARNHRTILYVDPEFQVEEEILLAALAVRVDILEEDVLMAATSDLRCDPDFMLKAAAINIDVLKYADRSLLEDPDFILAAIGLDARAITYVGWEGWQSDQEFILLATKKSATVIFYIDETLKKDPTFMLDAIRINAAAFRHADTSLRSNARFALKAIKLKGAALQYADDSLKLNKTFVQTAVRTNGWAFYHVDASLRQDVDYMVGVLASVGWSLPTVDRGTLRLDEKTYRTLRDLNIEFPQRFCSQRLLREVIQNRQNLATDDTRPMIVFLYPKADHNRAFVRNEMEEFAQRNYRIVYFESSTDLDDYSNLLAATLEVGKQARYIEWGGHGTQEKVSRSAPDPALGVTENEIYYFDTSDVEEMRALEEAGDFRFADCIEPGGRITWRACSTGKGREGTSNVANATHDIFGVPVKAPEVPTGFEHYVFDEDNRIIDVVYHAGTEFTYSINEDNFGEVEEE